MAISPIKPGTTRIIEITLPGTPDIRNDTVMMMVKSHKDDADPGVIQIDADVTIKGANGIAIFTMTPTDTNIAIGQYYFDVVWTVGSAIYVLDVGQETLRISERISDTS